jgi:hypothetical protein
MTHRQDPQRAAAVAKNVTRDAAANRRAPVGMVELLLGFTVLRDYSKQCLGLEILSVRQINL